MIVLGIDIGGKTRNGFCVMEESKILETSFIVYEKGCTPRDHRFKILGEAKRYVDKYNIDFILFEKINLFRGQGISPLSNILSLCKLQTTLIDNLSGCVEISEVMVRSWKAAVLGSAKSSKEDSIRFVRDNYPDIDIEIKRKDRNGNEVIEYNHDLCDSICIARFAYSHIPYLKDHRVSYK